MSSQSPKGAAAPAKSPGLRERKKQQTRLALSNVATRLFIERGFDNVTVAEVAEAAQVSVNTLFNYFSTKEELFFDRSEELEREPSRVVRERRPGESALDALWRAFEGANPRYFSKQVAPFFRTIEASAALKRRERLLFERTEVLLAEAFEQESGAGPGDPTARTAAALIIAIQWMLSQEVRTRLLRGESDEAVRKSARRLAKRAFDLLRPSLGDYCRRDR